MPIKMTLVAVLLLGCTAYGDPLRCAQRRLVDANSKLEIISAVTCSKEKDVSLVSRSCVIGICQLKARAINLVRNDPFIARELLKGGRGNPGYTLCRRLGGSPHYVDASTFVSAILASGIGVCVLGADNSFSDIGTLLRWTGFGIESKK